MLIESDTGDDSDKENSKDKRNENSNMREIEDEDSKMENEKETKKGKGKRKRGRKGKLRLQENKWNVARRTGKRTKLLYMPLYERRIGGKKKSLKDFEKRKEERQKKQKERLGKISKKCELTKEQMQKKMQQSMMTRNRKHKFKQQQKQQKRNDLYQELERMSRRSESADTVIPFQRNYENNNYNKYNNNNNNNNDYFDGNYGNNGWERNYKGVRGQSNNTFDRDSPYQSNGRRGTGRYRRKWDGRGNHHGSRSNYRKRYIDHRNQYGNPMADENQSAPNVMMEGDIDQVMSQLEENFNNNTNVKQIPTIDVNGLNRELVRSKSERYNNNNNNNNNNNGNDI